MPLLLNELLERLKGWDEIYLLERLDIKSEDLIDRFIDLIEEKFESLETEVLGEDGEYATAEQQDQND